MAGYHGCSMSNNAVAAYRNGEKPLSRWTKDEILSLVEDLPLKCSFEKVKKLPLSLLKDYFLKYSSWHHTGMHYRETDFYELDEFYILDVTDENIDQWMADYKKEKEEEKQKKAKKPIGERWRCEYLEWYGTRKHPHADTVIEEGTIIGNWFYRDCGRKKSINARGFRMIEKIEKAS